MEPLLQGPSLMVPLNDVMVDLDPMCSAKDIANQLGCEGTAELQESLRRIKEQTEALLAQFDL